MARTYEWSDGTVRRQPEPPGHCVKHEPEDTGRDEKALLKGYSIPCTNGLCMASRNGTLTGGMSEADVHNAGRPTEVPQFNKPVKVEAGTLVGSFFSKVFGGKSNVER